MPPWMPPPSALIYGASVLTLALGLLLFGGIHRLRNLLLSKSSSTPTLSSPAPLFLLGCTLIGLCAWQTPSLVPGSALALALILLSRNRLRPVPFWGLQRPHLGSDLRLSLTTLLTVLVPILILLATSSGIFLVLGWPLEPQPALLRFMEARDAKTLAPFLLYALVIAPAWEELFFRGTLFPWLSSRVNPLQAQWLSALAFGAVHLHGPTLIPLTCLGAVLVGMYRTTQSLIPSFLLHSLFNANTCIMLLLARPPLNS